MIKASNIAGPKRYARPSITEDRIVSVGLLCETTASTDLIMQPPTLIMHLVLAPNLPRGLLRLHAGMAYSRAISHGKMMLALVSVDPT